MLFEVLLYSFLSGITVFIGALSSYYFEQNVHNQILKDKIIHFLVAFGTGIMLSAIAFVLIPKGMENLDILTSSSVFISGAIAFYFLDSYIQKSNTNISQVLAMLLDFIPESIALGALFVYDHEVGILLALFIGLQNLPESFNSYIDLRRSRFSIKSSLVLLFFLSFIGVIFSSLGYFFLDDKIEVTSGLMLFASGGILYLIFQDIAPSIKTKNSRFIAMGVNLGFVIGMFGEALI